VGLALLYCPDDRLVAVVAGAAACFALSSHPAEAVFEPLVGIFRKSRALEIVAFLLLYKFGENLATALTRPFLIQKCFSPEDVGLADRDDRARP
jgi:PAT family beta-lactamase induction signal transducer AmpG